MYTFGVDLRKFCVKIPVGCSTELSPEGIQFISALFEKYDEDKDSCLSPSELANLFSVCPSASIGKEVRNSLFLNITLFQILAAVETNPRGWITYTGYMAYWK